MYIAGCAFFGAARFFCSQYLESGACQSRSTLKGI